MDAGNLPRPLMVETISAKFTERSKDECKARVKEMERWPAWTRRLTVHQVEMIPVLNP